MFAAVEGEVLVLTTEKGIGIVSNRLYLEPEVSAKPVEYLDEWELSKK